MNASQGSWLLTELASGHQLHLNPFMDFGTISVIWLSKQSSVIFLIVILQLMYRCTLFCLLTGTRVTTDAYFE